MSGSVNGGGRSFVERVGMDDSYSLELVTGKNVHGQPSWSLLLLPANKVQELRRELATKDVVLEDFGEVMARGDGEEPPEDLVEEILGLVTKK